MYEATDDPYCYPGTSVLRNLLDLRTQEELDEFEALITAQRAEEPLALRGLDIEVYRAIHRHLFQDVFDWAGEFRTTRISKAGSMFCYPENIGRELERVFGDLVLDAAQPGRAAPTFAASAAHILAELNAIHPFREGNGRTQNVFLAVIGERADRPLDLTKLEPQPMLDAMVASFGGNEELLAEVILSLM